MCAYVSCLRLSPKRPCEILLLSLSVLLSLSQRKNFRPSTAHNCCNPTCREVLVFSWVFDVPALPCPSPRVWMPVNGPGSLGWEARLLGRTDTTPVMGTRRTKYLGWQAAFQGFALGLNQVFICSLLHEGHCRLLFALLISKINKLPFIFIGLIL